MLYTKYIYAYVGRVIYEVSVHIDDAYYKNLLLTVTHVTFRMHGYSIFFYMKDFSYIEAPEIPPKLSSDNRCLLVTIQILNAYSSINLSFQPLPIIISDFCVIHYTCIFIFTEQRQESACFTPVSTTSTTQYSTDSTTHEDDDVTLLGINQEYCEDCRCFLSSLTNSPTDQVKLNSPLTR